MVGNLRLGSGKQIVHISSGLGSIEENDGGGFYGYRESKAALNMFTRSLAADLGPEGFTCIVMHPGWVKTDMGTDAATLSIEEGAKTIVDLVLRDEESNSRFIHLDEELPW